MSTDGGRLQLGAVERIRLGADRPLRTSDHEEQQGRRGQGDAEPHRQLPAVDEGVTGGVEDPGAASPSCGAAANAEPMPSSTWWATSGARPVVADETLER